MSHRYLTLLNVLSEAGPNSPTGGTVAVREELERELELLGLTIGDLRTGNLGPHVDVMKVYDAIVRICQKHRIPIDIEEDPEWAELHERLLRALHHFGTNDPAKHGDFWLVDDYFGTKELKLIIMNVDLIDKLLVAAVQDVLKGRFENYHVYVVLDDPDHRQHDELEIFWDHVVERRRGAT